MCTQFKLNGRILQCLYECKHIIELNLLKRVLHVNICFREQFGLHCVLLWQDIVSHYCVYSMILASFLGHWHTAREKSAYNFCFLN